VWGIAVIERNRTFILYSLTVEMSSRKQRLDVGSSESNKPRKRRFDDGPETDYFNNSNKSKDNNSMSQSNETTTNSNINKFTMKPYSHQYFELFKKRRQLPVWEYKEAFMATLDKNQVKSFSTKCTICLSYV
jgi:pre-mRNA-splicing factor ATP-dependent RNA helicase DHX15/PRP43